MLNNNCEQISYYYSTSRHGQKKQLSIFDHLPPPNPIYDKGEPVDETIKWKYILSNKQNPIVSGTTGFFIEEEDEDQKIGLLTYFEKSKQRIVYLRFNNSQHNMIPLNNARYTSSVFFDPKKLILDQYNQLDDLIPGQRKSTTPTKPVLIRGRNTERHHSVMEINGDINGRPLKFNSHFESGNLFAAIRSGERSYDLILQNDTNSKGHTQWFFFSVENTIKNQMIKFKIINFLKNDSLFNYGQQPVCFSIKKNEKLKQISWLKCGTNISYFKNRFFKENQQQRNYYTLTFTYTFEYSGDTVYFAQCYPYTYRDLFKRLDFYESDPNTKKLFTIKELCKSQAKLNIPIILIKAPNSQNKPNIVIMARQHPGETPSSWMMEGVMDFLLGQSLEAEVIRFNMNIYLIPMINPDGVVCGNYRCNLSGIDLNRIWNTPLRENHEAVYYTKELIKELKKTQDVKLVLDLHGHSKKFNAFFYGNQCYNSPGLRPRLMPLIMSRINTGLSLVDCSFTQSESKKNTARITLQEELGVGGLSFTFETSFHGQQKPGLTAMTPFTIESYKNLGRDVMVAYFKFQKATNLNFIIPTTKTSKSCLSTEKNTDVDQFLMQISDDSPILNELGQNDTSGSDSQPEVDNLIDTEAQSFQQQNSQPKRIQSISCDSKKSRLKFTTRIKRLIKMEKQTQTEMSNFQDVLLDPNVLKLIEDQLVDLRKQQQEQTKSSQKRPHSEQHTQRCSFMKKSINLFDEDSLFVSDNNQNIWLPIQVNGQQYKKPEKPLTEQSQNLEFIVQERFINQECQTDISLQKVLGNVQIYQIKMNQNQTLKSTLIQHNENNRNKSPLILFLQNNKMKEKQMDVQQLMNQKKLSQITQQPTLDSSPNNQIQKNSNQNQQSQSFMQNVHNYSKQVKSNTQSQETKFNKDEIKKSPSPFVHEEPIMENNSFQQRALMTTRPPEIKSAQRRWNSLHQSQQKSQQAQQDNSLPVSPPSFKILNDKKNTNNQPPLKGQVKIHISKVNINSNLKQFLPDTLVQYQNAHPQTKIKQIGAYKSKMINLSFTQGKNPLNPQKQVFNIQSRPK